MACCSRINAFRALAMSKAELMPAPPSAVLFRSWATELRGPVRSFPPPSGLTGNESPHSAWAQSQEGLAQAGVTHVVSSAPAGGKI